jgi:endonuclease YncB( thermonuclease family)
MVAEVVLPDGRDLNQELVKAGHAWWYSKYGPDDMELEALEARARDRHIGLWSALNPLPPWEWRKATRGSQSSRDLPRSRAKRIRRSY